jgi:hypothetical protein
MADDPGWIDEAAEQQIAPQDTPSPDAPVTPNDPGMMQRLYEFINRNVFPKREPTTWQPGDKEPYFNKGPMARPPLVPDNYAPESRYGAVAQPVPMPRARPDDADAKAYDENRGWDALTERQKQMVRAQQMQQYKQIMKGRR